MTGVRQSCDLFIQLARKVKPLRCQLTANIFDDVVWLALRNATEHELVGLRDVGRLDSLMSLWQAVLIELIVDCDFIGALGLFFSITCIASDSFVLQIL